MEKIDPARQKVSGTAMNDDRFEIPYDKLLIATGSAAFKPDIAGIDLPEVNVLKTLEDGRKIKEHLKSSRVKKAVIIGMGYIALEMCESLVGLSIAVDMVKPNPTLLPWLEPSMARTVREELEAKGVGIYAGHSVERLEKTAGGLTVNCRDVTLAADMVLVGIGVTPCSRIAEKAGLELGPNDSIAVDRKLKTSNEHIYAAGDCADARHVVTGEKTWIPLALRANRAGWAVADNVCGKETELDGVAGTAVFKVFDYEIARTGLNMAEAQSFGFDPVQNMIKSGSKAHAHPGNTPIWVNMIGDKTSGRLLGAQMVGKAGVAHRINAPAVALHNQMTVQQFSQTDLAYAPPFGPTWDPTLTAANQLLKKL